MKEDVMTPTGATRKLALVLAGALALGAFWGAGPATAFEDEWVTSRDAGGEAQTMTRVDYLDAKPNGTVYVSDSNNGGATTWSRIRIFDSGLGGSSSFGTYGSGTTQLRGTGGIALDAAGNIYVRQGSSSGPAVKKFNPSGTTVLDTIGTNIAVSSGAAGPGQIMALGSIDVDSAGNLYVADPIKDTISKFDANGDYVTRFGGTGTEPGQINDLMGIAVAPDGNVHAVNWNYRTEAGARVRDSRINEYQPDGTFVGAWGHDNTDRFADLSWTDDLDFDANGMAYVTDSFSYMGPGLVPEDLVKVFDQDRRLVYRFGRYADDGSEGWNMPDGIALDNSGGVYVADNGNKRVVKWRLAASEPDLTGTSPVSPSGETTFSVLGSADPGATVRLYGNANCTGAPLATGTAGELGGEGIEVTVSADTSVTVWAQATSSNGGASGCGDDPVTYAHETPPPEPPVLSGSDPAGPADDNSPLIRGTAADASTVELYANSACTGEPVASGAADELAGDGIEVSVADNTTTTFHATSTIDGRTSACSSSSVTYEEKSPVVTCPDGQVGVPPDCSTPPPPPPPPPPGGDKCPAGKVGTPPNCTVRVPPGEARIAIGKVKPIKAKAGRSAILRVPVTSSGDTAATGVKVCASVTPKAKRRTVKVARCAELGSVDATGRMARLPVRATRKARGQATLRIAVTSSNAGSATAGTTFTAKRAPTRR